MISKNTIYIILSFVLGLGMMFVFNRQAIKFLVEEKNICETEKKRNVSLIIPTTKPLTKQEIYILADKMKKMEEYQPQKLYFSSEVRKVEGGIITVVVKIEGNEESLLDAADLRLDFNDGVQILDVKKGNVFISYPQLSVQGASILVTGIASVKEKGMEFGNVGEVFATITLNKIKPKATLFSIKNDTDIYLMGESVYDTEKPDVSISL